MDKDMVLRVFKDPPVIETNRLYLRKLLKADSRDMAEYATDSNVTRFLTWHPHPDESYTLRYLNYVAGKYRSGSFYDWSLILRSENKMIGTCGFTRLDYINNIAEIGYVINPRYWNLGIATEAVHAVIRYAFYSLDVNRVEAKYIKGNDASRKVMEKAGMHFEGMHEKAMFVKNAYVSVGICAILKEDYLVR